MKNYKYIFFDLDGTITDPGEGITNSVAHSLKYYGIEVADKRELYTFIGPPLYASYMKYYGFSRDEAHRAVERYREYYADKGVFECTLYPGIERLLRRLAESDKRVVLATSKPEIFANKILKHFGLEPCFDLVAGATLDSTRVEKADVIKYALDSLGITCADEVLMIGDREHDVLGAAAFNIDALGVTFGYGSRAELEAAGAGDVAESVEDIENLLF